MSHPDRPTIQSTSSTSSTSASASASTPQSSSSQSPSEPSDFDAEHDREQMSLTALRLFSILRVFRPAHWPYFLLVEKMEEVSRERRTRTQYSDSSQKRGYKLWKCAQSVLRYWAMHNYTEEEEGGGGGAGGLN